MSESHPNHHRPILEGLTGLSGRVDFDAVVVSRLAEEVVSQDELMERNNILRAHGIELDGSAAPESNYLGWLTPDDWRRVTESDRPLFALWSATNIRKRISRLEGLGRHPAREIYEHVYGRSSLYGRALMQSLPLVHGTTAAGLERALQRGQFVGNRGVHEMGGDALASGFTTFMDRHLGLDGYVFADFGRPHGYRMNNQPEVVVSFSPEAMFQDGAFVTERDIADCRRGVREYLAGLSTPEDFYRAAELLLVLSSSEGTHREGNQEYHDRMSLRAFADGDNGVRNSLGGIIFSTWEAKMREVGIDYIDKVIVRDEEQYTQLKNRYPDIEIIFQPELSQHIADVRSRARFEEAFARLEDEDYRHRVERLEGAEDVTQGYVILGGAHLSQQSNIEGRLSVKSDPRRFALGGRPTVCTDRLSAIALAEEHHKTEFFPLLIDGSIPEVNRYENVVAIAPVRASSSRRVEVITGQPEWVSLR